MPVNTKFTETGWGPKIRKSVRARVLIKSDLDSNEQRGWKMEPKRTLGGDKQIKPRDHFFAGWGLESILEWAGPLNWEGRGYTKSITAVRGHAFQAQRRVFELPGRAFGHTVPEVGPLGAVAGISSGKGGFTLPLVSVHGCCVHPVLLVAKSHPWCRTGNLEDRETWRKRPKEWTFHWRESRTSGIACTPQEPGHPDLSLPSAEGS